VDHLRDLLRQGGLLVVPAVYDALSGRIAERLGFKAVGLGGFLVAASRLGLPDVGYLTMSEMAEATRALAAAVRVPVLADGDTGYGNPLNVRRTVREFEAAGAHGIVLEDQEWPKQCGHIPGDRRVVPLEEHLKKLEAALEARRDPRTVIVARTDSRGGLGFDEAIRRARAYHRLGVDAVFIEALRGLDELRRAPAELPGVPLVANMFSRGKTPLLAAAELQALGYRVALWVTDALWAAARAVQEVLGALRDQGTTAAVQDRLMGFEEYFDLVGLPEHRALEQRYAP
jgi:2-methylisocitrate lyase-like PEP mutase family enzyme